MKVQIRHGVFETNSSSTHSLTICKNEDFDKWVKGELYWNEDTNSFINQSEYDKIIVDNMDDMIKDDIDIEDTYEVSEYIRDNFQIASYNTYRETIGYEFETFTENYTTENGDKITVFGYYGYC